MSDVHRRQIGAGTAAAAIVCALLLGVLATYFLMRERAPDAAPSGADSRGAAAPTDAPQAGQQAAPGEVVVTLTKEAIERAAIRVAAATPRQGADTLRLPGVVEANAYRQVAVTPLVSGRVVRASTQLGDRVRKGQSIARVYSPELAEARTKYVAARAMLDAHDRELQRTQKLVEIGAASRQELERLHAEHSAQTSELESAEARLRLLVADPGRAGGTPEESATVDVSAPIDGVITERLANTGLNVAPDTRLFTIVDLANVWIVASVYERDLPRVREGAQATVTVAAMPERALDGRVTYIDPQLDTSTRTARIRIETANPSGLLRLGMYADVQLAGATPAAVLTVPRAAVQNVGDAQVVYLSAAPDGTRFVERRVEIGRTLGDHVEVLSGLAAGDTVVADGSFFVRAEVERLGLRATPAQAPARVPAPAARPATPMGSASAPAAPAAPLGSDTVRVAITEKGFEPAAVTVRAGVRTTIDFTRKTDQTCATEVVFPSLNIRRALPLNEAVAVEVTPAQPGEIAFACGMNMLRGTVVAR